MQRETLATFDMTDDTYELEAVTMGEGDPHCAVTAGVHGDEKPSIEVAEELVDSLDEEAIEGRLTVVPSANVFACLDNTRLTPWPKYERNESEQRNLNRCFDVARRRLQGEDVPVNVTQRMACSVLDTVRDADYLLDLHTATWPGKKVPQARYKVHDRFDDAVVDRMRELAFSSGLDHVMESRPEQIGGGVLAAVVPRMGVPAITFEVGGAGHFTDSDFETYLDAVRHVLAETGTIDGEPGATEPTVIGALQPVYTPEMGVLHHEVGLGERVAAGDTVARVEPVDGGEAVLLQAPCDGVIESLQQSRVVNQNARVGNVARTDN